MTSDQDDYKPRDTDHLVEPMFVGLSVGEEKDASVAEDKSPAKRLLRRLLEALGLASS